MYDHDPQIPVHINIDTLSFTAESHGKSKPSFHNFSQYIEFWNISLKKDTPPSNLFLIILHSTNIIHPKCRRIKKSEVPNGGNEHHGPTNT